MVLQDGLREAWSLWLATYMAASAVLPPLKNWRAALRLALGVFLFAMLAFYVNSQHFPPHSKSATAGAYRWITPAFLVRAPLPEPSCLLQILLAVLSKKHISVYRKQLHCSIRRVPPQDEKWLPYAQSCHASAHRIINKSNSLCPPAVGGGLPDHRRHVGVHRRRGLDSVPAHRGHPRRRLWRLCQCACLPEALYTTA